jgi:membrane associated rhomboid family serine protease
MFPLKDNIPNERFPLVTVALIAINVIAYLLSIRHGGSLWSGPSDQVVTHYGAIPYELTHPGKHCDLAANLASQVVCQGQPRVSGAPPAQPPTWETAFTGMFLHANLLHIGGNMLFLAIFGPNVEDAMGHVKYTLFYLLGGLAALGTQTVFDPNSTGPTLGASGAIAAVLGAYIVLYPRARILTLVFIFFFFTLIELPALVVLGLWFLEQVAFAGAGLTNPVSNSGGVAYFAHVGGFVLGLVLVRLLARGPRSPAPRYPVY